MRTLLYITPYFPPQAQVGAMRPLKFVRYLRAHGWQPLVLCDLWRGASLAHGLADRVPDDIEVVRDYSYRASRAETAWRQRSASPHSPGSPDASDARDSTTSPRRPPQSRRSLGDTLLAYLPRPLANPELIPLGEHSVHMPHALRAGARLLHRYACDAILVNADPYAALLVGTWLGMRFDLPVISDLRDPWAPCAQRRPLRPTPVRQVVDALERHVVERAARVIVNTDVARQAYLRHYPDIDPARFITVRNHGDPGLLDQVPPPVLSPATDRFTLLVLGSFRRFLEGEAIIGALAELSRRGYGPERLQLLVTGKIPDSTEREAAARGVSAYLKQGQFVPYPAIGTAMAEADLLVLQGHITDQRIPAKLYDYLLSERPILALDRSAELGQILADTGAGCAVHPSDVMAAANYIESQLVRGRHPVAERRGIAAYTSDAASARLATILDDAVSTHPSSAHG